MELLLVEAFPECAAARLVLVDLFGADALLVTLRTFSTLKQGIFCFSIMSGQ